MHPSEKVTKQLTVRGGWGGVNPYGQPDRKISGFFFWRLPLVDSSWMLLDLFERGGCCRPSWSWQRQWRWCWIGWLQFDEYWKTLRRFYPPSNAIKVRYGSTWGGVWQIMWMIVWIRMGVRMKMVDLGKFWPINIFWWIPLQFTLGLYSSVKPIQKGDKVSLPRATRHRHSEFCIIYDI